MSSVLRRALVLLATLALPLGLLAATPAPAVSAAAPSLAALPGSAQVGRTLTLRGTAPAGVVVTVQRRYGSGAFARVGAVRATRSGSWSLRYRLARGGTTSFRALAGGRTSAVRALKVFQWLDVVDQSYGLTVGESRFARHDVTARIGGADVPHSIEVDDLGNLALKTAGLCSRLQLRAGIEDRDRPGADGDEVVDGSVERVDDDGYVGGGPALYDVTAAEGLRTFTIPLTAGGRTARIVTIRFLTDDPDEVGGMRSVLGTPRVLCNATRLPELPREEYPD